MQLSATATTLPLSGDGWLLSSPPRVRNIPALVPNDMADDLVAPRLLPDLYFGTNSMNASRWIWERDWTLRRNFTTPGAAATLSWLAFDGVDHNCSVSLNGKFLGSRRRRIRGLRV